MSREIESYKRAGVKVKIFPDEDPQNPREDDNVGIMVCWHRNYSLGDEQPKIDGPEWMDRLAFDVHSGLEDYLDNGLYTKTVTASHSSVDEEQRKAQVKAYNVQRREIIQAVLEKHYVMLPLFLYDHSGITMSTGAFSCRWDSGQVGWIYTTLEKVREMYKGCTGDQAAYATATKWTPELRAEMVKRLESEVEIYDQYLTGDIYGYVIEDDDGNDLDSCWGFYGIDEVKEQANEMADQCGVDYAKKLAKEEIIRNQASVYAAKVNDIVVSKSVLIPDNADVREAGDGYYVAAEVFVPKAKEEAPE